MGWLQRRRDAKPYSAARWRQVEAMQRVSDRLYDSDNWPTWVTVASLSAVNNAVELEALFDHDPHTDPGANHHG